MKKTGCTYAFIMMLSFTALVAPRASAGEPSPYSGTYTLEEVVVSAGGDSIEQAGTVRRITAEDIEMQGARSLDEAIDLVPGLNIRTGGKGVPRVNLRGFRSRHVLLLLDGVPINSTYDGMFDPSMIPVENVRDIKITTGGSSVLYGPGALGGVINILTKRGRPGISGSIDHQFGEHVDYYGRYSLSGAEKNVDFFLSSSLYRTEGYELSHDFDETAEENGGLRENSHHIRKNIFAKIGYTPSDRLQLGLTLYYNSGEYGNPPNTINDKTDPFAKKVKYERVEDLDIFSLQLSASYDMPGPWEMKSWVYFNQQDEEKNRYDDRYNSIDDIYIKKTYCQDTTSRVIGANLQARCDLDKLGLLTLGGALEHDRWDADGDIRDKMVSLGGVTPADLAGGGGGGTGGGSGGGSGPGGKKKKFYYMRRFDNNNHLEIYSLAAEYECFPAEDLAVKLGYSHHFLCKEAGDHDDEYSFAAGARYDLSRSLQLHGSVSRKIRFPSIRQLYDETQGNPGLDYERSYNYELGVSAALPWYTSLHLVGFCNDVENYIQKDDYTERFENRDRYRFRGVEISIESRPVRGLMLRLGYTYMDSDDMSTGSSKDHIQYNPRDKLTVEARYTWLFGLTAYASVKHINRQYFYSKKEPVLERELNEYTLVDVKLSQRLFNSSITAYLGADNLFDKDYETSYGLPQAGRFVYGGMKVSF